MIRFIIVQFIIVLAFASPAIADVNGTADPENTQGIFRAIRKHKGYQPPAASLRAKIGSSAKPMARNKWGGVPCVTLADGTIQCFGQPAVPPPTKPGAPTPGDILTAIKKIGLPSLEINIQPGDETLVNFDTIFYARPQPFRRSVNLLDYDIDLVATPAGYTWHHGDGTSHTTSQPGGPYPSKDVTYRYQESAQNLRPSVDVTYAVRYRVDGGAWQNLSQTLQASGPADDLDVREATPVLARY